MTLGDRIESALRKRHMSQADLARALHKKPATVSHWVTGRRNCPPEVVGEIATVLRVSKAWLLSGKGGTNQKKITEDDVTHARRTPREDLATNLDWHFRSAPRDGGRDFGNANTYATPPNIATFVRELGQNSTDAAFRMAGAPMPVTMRFSVIELTRGSEQYERFLSASRFPEVEAHIGEAVSVAGGRSKLAAKLRVGLRSVRTDDRLMLLRVDDYGTVGLHGPELGAESADEESRSSPYAALVRNNLDSSKESATAGGAYGLGKAVLWNCSAVSTVLFASRIPDESLLRLTGRTELTWHRQGGDPFAGPGWFGTDPFGSSVWTRDEELLADLCLNRDMRLPVGVDRLNAHGTSALVVGFADPQVEGPDDAADLVRRLSKAAAENFFPAMMWGKLQVFVEHSVDGEVRSQGEVIPDTYVPEFCAALDSHMKDEIAEELTDVATTTRRVVAHRVPGTRQDAEAIDQFPESGANAHLLVRLDDDTNEGSEAILTNSVALVRGRGMVVQYWPREGVAMGSKPFHAIVLAGEAASSEVSQRAAEQFLRLAEPPAHDKWVYGQEMKTSYKVGARQRLDEFKKSITEELKKAIQPQAGGEADGPEELKRLLSFGSVSGVGTPLATLRNIRAQLIDGSWTIDAEIHFNDRNKRIRISPRAWIDVESGGAIRLPWARLSFHQGSRELQSEGDAVITGPSPQTLRFSGVTESSIDGIQAALCRAKIDLYMDVLPALHEARDAA